MPPAQTTYSCADLYERIMSHSEASQKGSTSCYLIQLMVLPRLGGKASGFVLSSPRPFLDFAFGGVARMVLMEHPDQIQTRNTIIFTSLLPNSHAILCAAS